MCSRRKTPWCLPTEFTGQASQKFLFRRTDHAVRFANFHRHLVGQVLPLGRIELRRFQRDRCPLYQDSLIDSGGVELGRQQGLADLFAFLALGVRFPSVGECS